MYEYKATLIKVVDGDTIDVIIDLGFRMTTEQRIRLKGINTPEIWRTKKDSEEYRKGIEAKNYVIERLNNNNNTFILRTDKDAGMYGRYISDVILSDSELTLNDSLIKEGYATVYD